ncbi:unnamed protein product [Neospora caninum Liverpool]|uniref:AP2 domain transcription factor AP2XII-3 n=1 Tax=Neospora caninum (strain Liverpool) TaxID=572307 RepID=F0VQC2_NEOCL|nr:uncharacterized protein NCLIV_063450 [Neospora caninum Liverpool]CBZ55919.1 unnamed protein product [Neospora caninum Liverpool]CEL70662.1 TPA: AP2 domain transcription factor AP2XII-3 [Neospora caninum Liverpool]|eukprot:XP_003885945.1 uncharacterized protein NCLIV_063450 [Neospora caninum Liverpool]
MDVDWQQQLGMMPPLVHTVPVFSLGDIPERLPSSVPLSAVARHENRPHSSSNLQSCPFRDQSHRVDKPHGMKVTEEENRSAPGGPLFLSLQEEILRAKAGESVCAQSTGQHQRRSREENDAEVDWHAPVQPTEITNYTATGNSSVAATMQTVSFGDSHRDEYGVGHQTSLNRMNTPVCDTHETAEVVVPASLGVRNYPYLEQEGACLAWVPQWLSQSLPYANFHPLYSPNQVSSLCSSSCCNSSPVPCLPECSSSVPVFGDAYRQSNFEPVAGTNSVTSSYQACSHSEESQHLLRSFWSSTGSTCPRLPLPIRAAAQANCCPSLADEALPMHVLPSFPPYSSKPSPTALDRDTSGGWRRKQRCRKQETDHRKERKKAESYNGRVSGHRGSTQYIRGHGKKSGEELQLSDRHAATFSLPPWCGSPPTLPDPDFSTPFSACHGDETLSIPEMQHFPLSFPGRFSGVPASAPSFSSYPSETGQTDSSRPPPQVPPTKQRPGGVLTEMSTGRTGRRGSRQRPLSPCVSSLLGPLAAVEWRSRTAGLRLSTKFGYLQCDRTGEPLCSPRWESGCEGVFFDNQKGLWRVTCSGEKKITKSFSPKLLGGFDAAKTVAMLYRIWAAEREDVVTEKLSELALEWKQHEGKICGDVNSQERGICVSGASTMNRENIVIPFYAPSEAVVEGILRNEAESGSDSPHSLLEAAINIVSQMHC